ncbi:malate dehydrogenase [Staphylococcus piscifermentans]|uniref:Malate dehydrogenase n=1 Tax=Staphylococcus piscifermentans TaxID=70258 RepID=A0A239UDG1_9STAP|nr:malate dehydrogenase [Staphylococcus piscifermentans]RTX84886.1 malate dehydrogenase [Staphylococcus piscifermentans]GEP83821.1 malate dehydrogenase [Staphylococcus piscifermentans]SNV08131.1 malate dehydrogenase [Staphylococcus piscifermentans]
MTKNKIAIIGAGHTGSTLAFIIAERALADVVLLEIPDNEKPARGKALDIKESGPILGFNGSVVGTSNYEDIQGADIVVITAGAARKPGMSRDDLIQINENVMAQVTEGIKKYAPESKIIVLTNPVDAMTYAVYKLSGFPKERVLGQSGILDTARYRTFVSEALDVAQTDVTGLVLGGHGDTMVPILSTTLVGGVPLKALLPQDKIDAIVERTRKGGAEIVGLLGNGSAYYAPAAAIYEMAAAILRDEKRLVPAITYLDGEYGFKDICLGVPTILGANGVEKVVELDLTEDEQHQLQHSAEAVEEVKSALKKK